MNIILALIYFATLYFHRQADFWQNYFFTQGHVVLLYHLSHLFLLFMWSMLLIGSGQFILKKFNQTNNLTSNRSHLIIHSIFIGGAFISFFISLISYFHLLNWYLISTTTTILVFLFASSAIQLCVSSLKSIWKKNFLSKIALLAVLIEVFYLTIVRALVPDLFVTDSLGHYLPFYQNIFNSQGLIWPTPFYVDYFFIKGEGLPILFGALTDVNATQLTSFIFFISSGLILYTWLSKVFDQSEFATCISLSLLLIYYANATILSSEFQKLHIINSSYLIYLVFLFSENSFKKSESKLTIVNYLFLIAIAWMCPPFMLFVELYLSSLILSQIFERDWAQVKTKLKLVLIIAVLTLVALFVNRLTTGIYEITPFSMAVKLSNPATRPPGLSLFHLRYLNLEEGIDRPSFNFASNFLNDFSTGLAQDIFSQNNINNYIMWFVTLTLFAIFVYSFTKKNEWKWQWFKSIFIFYISIILLKYIVTQNSFVRGLMFLPAIKLCLIAFSISALSSQLFPKIKNSLLKFIIIALIIFGTKTSTDLIINNPIFIQDKNLKLMTGQISYAQYYNFKENDPCTESRRHVGKKERIVLLHFIPACVGKPTDQLEYIDPTGFVYNSHVSLIQSPEVAKDELAKLGFQYFVWIPTETMYLYAYYPIFQPDEMFKNFAIEKNLTNGYLLRWRNNNDPDFTSDFKESYSRSIANDLKNPLFSVYKTWVEQQNKSL